MTQSEANEVRRRLNETGDKAAVLRDKLTARTDELKECIAKMEDLKQELRMKETELKQANARMQSSNTEEEGKRKEKADLEVEMARKSHAHPPASCRMVHHMRKQFEGTGHLRQTGSFLLDILSDTMDEDRVRQYGPALSAAGLGSDPVLVANEKCAKAVLDYVKEKQLGRVECLVRDRVLRANKDKALTFKKRIISGAKIPPRCMAALQLLNLPEDDDDLWVLFYARLGETFVTSENDPGEVRKIAEHAGERFRVVTTAGQVYERSGVVSGGAAANYLEQRHIEPEGKSADSLNKYRVAIEKLEIEIRNAATTKREAQAHATNVAETIRMLNRKLKQAEEEAADLRQLQNEHKKQLKVLQERDVDPVQAAEDQKALRNLDQQLLKLQDQAVHIQSKIVVEEKKRER